jgi:hypothetical protein
MRLAPPFIEKLLDLPENIEPSQFYLIEDNVSTKFYLSDTDGNLILLNDSPSVSIGDQEVAYGGGAGTLSSDATFYFNDSTGTLHVSTADVDDEVYGVGWNGSFEVPTKNALYDKIESIVAGVTTYTDEQAQDAVGSILTDSSTIDFTYDDAGNSINASVIQSGLTLNNIGGVLGTSKGGTNLTSYTTGDLLYASATNVLSPLPDVATGNALISGGVGVAPGWGKIGLSTHVSGSLPIGSGGTGVTSATANQIWYGTFQQSANLTYDGTFAFKGNSTAGSNIFTVKNSSSLQPFTIQGDGNVNIGATSNPANNSRVYIFGGANGANVDVRGLSGAFTDQAVIELEGNDYDTTVKSAYLMFRGSSFTGNYLGSIPNANLGVLMFGGTNSIVGTASSDLIFAPNFTEAGRWKTSGNLGIGTGVTVSARLHAISTTEQLRLGYNTSNYFSTTVFADSFEAITTFDMAASSGLSKFVFSQTLSTPGTGANSERFGNLTLASGAYSVALGSSAIAGTDYDTALGSSSIATGTGGNTAAGYDARATGSQSTAIGTSAWATAIASIAIGKGASTGSYTSSIALGQGVTTDTFNQLKLGSTSSPIRQVRVDSVGGSIYYTIAQDPITGVITFDAVGGTGPQFVFADNISASNLSGTNTGNVTLAGQNYLTISGQIITANPVNLSGTNITGTLPVSSGGTGITSANANQVWYGTFQQNSNFTFNSSNQVTSGSAIIGGGGITYGSTTAIFANAAYFAGSGAPYALFQDASGQTTINSQTTLKLALAGGTIHGALTASGLILDPGSSVSPAARLHVLGTTEQLRLAWSSGQYIKVTVNNLGVCAFDGLGTNTGFNFSTNVNIGNTTAFANAAPLQVWGTNPEQLRLQYDTSTYLSFGVNSVGSATIQGGGAFGNLHSLTVNTPTTTFSGTISASNLSGINTGDQSPGGIAGSVQYKSGTTLAGSANLVFVDSTLSNLTVTNTSSTGAPIVTCVNDASKSLQIGMYNTTRASYGAIASGTGFLYTDATALTLMIDNASGVIKFATGGNSEVARFDTVGNFGIGTIIPQAKLHVQSTTSPQFLTGYSTFTYLATSVSSTGVVTFDAVGSSPAINFIDSVGIGIGIAAPKNLLTISVPVGSVGSLPALGSGTGAQVGIYNNGQAYGLIQGVLSTGNSYLQVQRVDGTAIAFDLLLQPNGGNVGVGTSSPSGKFNILSTTEQLRLAYDATHYLTVTTDSHGAATFARVGDTGVGITFNSLTYFGADAEFYGGNVLVDYGGSVGIGAGVNVIAPPNVYFTAIAALLHIVSYGNGDQMRIGYDASNYTKVVVDSSGYINFTATGTGSKFGFHTSTATTVIGVGSGTPSTWDLFRGVIDGGGTAVGLGTGVQNLHFYSNAYYSGGDKYYSTAPASNAYLYNGEFHVRVAPSGTVNTNITWTDILTVNATGVGIGIAPTVLLDVAKSVSGGTVITRVWNQNTAADSDAVLRIVSSANANGNPRIEWTDNVGYNAAITANGTSGMVFRIANQGTVYSNLAEGMRLTSTGLGVGISPSVALHVVKTTEQLRLGYNASNYVSFTVSGSGGLTIDCVGVAKAVQFASGLALGFFGATVQSQPTTSIASASFVANSGTAVNDASTFDGYTIKQVVKALRNLGLLA